MRNRILTLASLFILVFSVACKNKQPEGSAEQVKSDSPEVKNYLPVLDFIKAEIRKVDSFYAGIKKINIRNGKTDSAFISTEEFHRITDEIESLALTKEDLEKNYEEASFIDHATSSVTFTYSAKDHQLPVKRVDVLTSQTEGYDKLKSMFIEKETQSGDTSIVKRIFWKAGRNFLLITQTTIGQKPAEVSQVKVVWDNGE